MSEFEEVAKDIGDIHEFFLKKTSAKDPLGEEHPLEASLMLIARYLHEINVTLQDIAAK